MILDAAREVFVADPGAPVSAVAEAAGVGMSALYRRYPSKEDLLRRLCRDGLETYIGIAEDCVADDGDPWEAFATFMRRQVEAGLQRRSRSSWPAPSRPTRRCTSWPSTPASSTCALFDRTAASGVLRPDVTVADIGLILEQIAAIAFGATPERTVVLRLRCVEIVLDGLRATDRPELPGPTVTDDEFAARWVPRG